MTLAMDGYHDNKDLVYKKLTSSGVRHPQVWKGFSSTTHKTGWHFKEFGQAEDVYMGRNKKEILDFLKDDRI